MIQRLAKIRFPLVPLCLFLVAAGLGIWLSTVADGVTWAALDKQVAQKDLTLDQYIATGLWLGGMASAMILVVLGLTWFWWGKKEALPVGWKHGKGEEMKLSGRWFALLLGLLIVFAGVQRWPALSVSFWGDESWAFCDFVHGKWKPLEKNGSMQEGVKFKPVTWKQTLFGDQSGNNHWMASALQRVTLSAWRGMLGKEPWQYDERVVRVVSLLGGLGSLVALACWMRRLGRPVMGLLAATLMALHPWHLRFSVEARGYGLMLLFLVLTLWAMTNALEKGRKRDWFWFGLAQFAVLYAWKGAVYPLAFLNLAVGAKLLFAVLPREGWSQKLTVLSRWMAANLLGAMLFLPLVMPAQLQVQKGMEQLRGRAKPMNVEWLHNTVAETLTGMPYHEMDSTNPKSVSIERLGGRSAAYPVAAAVVALLPFAGLLWWSRRDEFLAGLSAMLLMAAAVAMVHFKFVLRVELLPWYWLYTLPILAVLQAGALTGLLGMGLRFRWKQEWRQGVLSRPLAGAVAVGLMAWFWMPMTKDLQGNPRENHKQAWLRTRGLHEPAGYTGPSKVYTAWLWRYVDLYDARGNTQVRCAKTLRETMAKAEKEDGEFYMIIGDDSLCDALCGDMMAMLRDKSSFDEVETLWGVEHLNALTIYKMRKAPSVREVGPPPLFSVSKVGEGAVVGAK